MPSSMAGRSLPGAHRGLSAAASSARVGGLISRWPTALRSTSTTSHVNPEEPVSSVSLPVHRQWEQRAVRPWISRVENAIHFKVTPGRGRRGRAVVMKNAFVYDWRLWSVGEVREAMAEAGFAKTQVHDSVGGAIDSKGRLHLLRARDDASHDEDFVVYVVGRA